MPDTVALTNDAAQRHLALQRRAEADAAAAAAEAPETPGETSEPPGGPDVAVEAPAAVSGPESAVPGPADPHPVLQFAIVGYTPTCVEAVPLLDDPTWEVWGMNNLHLQPAFADLAPKFDAWFDLHPVADIRKDAPHAAWLAAGADGVPVWVWEPQPDWPTARPYPKAEVLARFGRYFTNTVSYQLALALLRIMAWSPDGRRAPDGARIAIYGIDMATSTEYAAQRPSVEYFLGMATGVGVEVVLPERSDLLKAASLYGESDGGLRAKLEERREHLQAQLNEANQIVAHHTAMVHALGGALEQVNYLLGVWTMPSIDRNAPQNAVTQDGASPTPT